MPLYVMNSDNEQALLGMDILSMGDFSATHYLSEEGNEMLRFSFNFADDRAEAE